MSKITRNAVRNRRVKGKSFEKRVAELIVKAFRESGLEEFKDLPNDAIRRRRVWEVSEDERGDLIKKSPLLREAFPWCVECKAQKAFPSLERLLLGRPKIWQEAWEQAVDQAIEMGEWPLLVWRKNQNDPIICARSLFARTVIDKQEQFEMWAKGGILIFAFEEWLRFFVVREGLYISDIAFLRLRGLEAE